MKKIGLFEAKTRLSAVCEEVSQKGHPILITRRGRPWVRIEPIAPAVSKGSTWLRRDAFVQEHGPLREHLELPKRHKDRRRNFLK